MLGFPAGAVQLTVIEVALATLTAPIVGAAGNVAVAIAVQSGPVCEGIAEFSALTLNQ